MSMSESISVDELRAQLQARVVREFGEISLAEFLLAVENGKFGDDPQAEDIAAEADLLDGPRWERGVTPN